MKAADRELDSARAFELSDPRFAIALTTAVVSALGEIADELAAANDIAEQRLQLVEHLAPVDGRTGILAELVTISRTLDRIAK